MLAGRAFLTTAGPSAGDAGPALADWKPIDAARDRFEAAGRAGAAPDLALFRADASGALRTDCAVIC